MQEDFSLPQVTDIGYPLQGKVKIARSLHEMHETLLNHSIGKKMDQFQISHIPLKTCLKIEIRTMA